ncbi:MAG: DNA-directed RNA polymerases I, II, and III subunit RPABC1, partial [Paramarteilia canceri]
MVAANEDQDYQQNMIYFQIRRTALQMCHDRGYLVAQAELDQSFTEFEQQFGNKP